MPYKQIDKLSNQVWNTDDRTFYDRSEVLLDVLIPELDPDYPLASYRTSAGYWMIPGSFLTNAPIAAAPSIILCNLPDEILDENFKLAGTTALVRDFTDPTGASDFIIGVDVNGAVIELRPQNTAFSTSSRFSFNLFVPVLPQ